MDTFLVFGKAQVLSLSSQIVQNDSSQPRALARQPSLALQHQCSIPTQAQSSCPSAMHGYGACSEHSLSQLCLNLWSASQLQAASYVVSVTQCAEQPLPFGWCASFRRTASQIRHSCQTHKKMPLTAALQARLAKKGLIKDPISRRYQLQPIILSTFVINFRHDVQYLIIIIMALLELSILVPGNARLEQCSIPAQRHILNQPLESGSIPVQHERLVASVIL